MIAGTHELDGDSPQWPDQWRKARRSAPIRCTLTLLAGRARIPLTDAAGHSAFLYAYEGSATSDPGSAETLPHRAAGVLSDGDRCRCRSSRTAYDF